MRAFLGTLIVATSLCGHARADGSLETNLGFSLSKSLLGVSYTFEKNQVNVGLKRFGIHAPGENWDGILQPGLTFNREIESGWYTSLTYAPAYVKLHRDAFGSATGGSWEGYFVGENPIWTSGWNSGEVFLGLGKNFQFTRWGVNIDANLITPATSDVLQAWGYWIGAGVSYRFRLE